MDIDKDIYHSNGMLGLIPVVDESEAMSFHYGGKLLSSDSKDFFNCDTSIGLEYPVRSALQPICVHVDGAESTNWVNPPCDENVDLLDISSKRLPVDLGFNGLDKSSSYSSPNGSFSSSNLTPNNHVIANSLPASSDVQPLEISDYYGNSMFNESYSMRADYGNHAPFGESEKVYYNGNQSLYSNGYHSQYYDHTNHVQHVQHLANHQIYHNHHQQPTTPLHHYQSQKRGQQPFQRHYTHRRRLNLYEKPSPSPVKHRQKQQQPQQSQSPVQAQKPPKPQKSPLIQRPQKSPKTQHQKLQPSPQQLQPKQQQITTKRKKQRIHVKSLETKSELNQRVVLKRKLGRPRKYDYSPPKPTKFRSHRLRLKVQSEEANSEDVQNSDDTLESEQKEQSKEKEKKVKEVLPCDWVRPDNLTFDRQVVSEYEKASLPEFFAGKFDRTHFHPSQYLQIRNLFLDEWESRKPNAVHFREMIRIHKGIGNVVSFSRVCKFLTAIGAINEISQDDDDDDDEVNKEDDVIKTEKKAVDDNSPTETDENQSRDEESEDHKDSSIQPSPLSPSTLPTPPSSSPERQTNGLSSTTSSQPSTPTPTMQSEDNSTQTVTSRPRRKGRKRKSYFLNEMTRLGIDPLSAGFPIPGYDADRQDKQDEESDLTSTIADNDDHNQSENVSQESIQN